MSALAANRPPMPPPTTAVWGLELGIRISLRRHSGAPRSGEPGIHTPQQWLWIPALASLGRNDSVLRLRHELVGHFAQAFDLRFHHVADVEEGVGALAD